MFAGRAYDCHGRCSLIKSVPEGLCPVERNCAGAVLEELKLMGQTHIGEVCEGLMPMTGTPHWSRVEWKERQTQCVMNICRGITAFFFCSPICGEKVKKRWEERRGVGRVF